MKNKAMIIGIVGIFVFGIAWSIVYEPQRVSNQVGRHLADTADVCLGATDERTSRIVCIKNHIRQGIGQYGVRAYMNGLESLVVKRGSTSVLHCHDIAHVIGKLGIETDGNWRAALSACTSMCGDGCFHGVVEGYLAKGNKIEQAVEQLCPPDNTSCFHGLGHGIASLVFDTAKSLTYCDKVPAGIGREQCGYGVLMELYESTTFDQPTLSLPDDVVSFCNSLWEPYTQICYSKAGVHEYRRTNDAAKAGLACQRVPNKKECIKLLGVLLYWQHQQSAVDLVGACNIADPGGYSCHQGVLEESVNIDPLAAHGFSVCFASPEAYKKECFVRLATILGASKGIDAIFPAVVGACNDAVVSPVDFSYCLSGVGRAFFVLSQKNPNALASVLSFCDRFPTEVFRKTCYNGGLYQYSFGGVFEPETLRPVSSDSAFSPCSELDSRYWPNCYFYQAMRYMKAEQGIRTVGTFCQGISDARSSQECAGGIGRVLASKPYRSAQQVVDECGSLPNQELITFCAIEAGREFLSQNKPFSLDLCSTSDEKLEFSCRKALDQFRCHVLGECSQ